MDNQFKDEQDRSPQREDSVNGDPLDPQTRPGDYRNAYEGPSPYGNMPLEFKHSGPGIASFIVAIIAAISFIGLFVALVTTMATELAGLIDLDQASQGYVDPQVIEQIFTSTSLYFIILGFMGALAGALIALILGIIGLVQKNRKRVFSVIGTVLSGLMVGFVILLIIPSFL